MDLNEWKKATRKGANIGIVMFIIFGIPLTMLYGSYGGYRFFARLGIGSDTEVWGRIGAAVGSIVGLFSFLFMFIALCASIAGGVYYLRWLIKDIKEREQ